MYQFKSRIRYSETDETGRLSVPGIINYMQDCSTFQSEDGRMGISYLKEHHRAWLLSGWRIVIDRYPKLGEEITAGTWHCGSKGFTGIVILCCWIRKITLWSGQILSGFL